MWVKLLLLALCFGAAFSLSCFCGTAPCQTTLCCESGLYTLDECGCCLTCAKAEGERCGGPFGVSGTCASGLRCLRQCECQTVQAKDCVFPFSYQGLTYNTCTDVGSDNGATWCATQVDVDGVVVQNTWQDCQDGCPGTDFECNEGFLFNEVGQCINGTAALSLLPRLQTGPLKAILDNAPSETRQKTAPTCQAGRAYRQAKGCKCSDGPVSKGLDGNPRGGCIPPLVNHGIEELAHGWCFLENVQDPQNPTDNCFADTQFSVTDGRFWSKKACNGVFGTQQRTVPNKSANLACLSVSSNPCIFPFTYLGVSYNSCTHIGSENEAPWCAVQVDQDGEVIKNAWEDCDAGCLLTGKTTVSP